MWYKDQSDHLLSRLCSSTARYPHNAHSDSSLMPTMNANDILAVSLFGMEVDWLYKTNRCRITICPVHRNTRKTLTGNQTPHNPGKLGYSMKLVNIKSNLTSEIIKLLLSPEMALET